MYQVGEQIGQGGMGEVFRARDTTLDRDVALKVLPQLFTDDPERLARFEREAKTLASLNHPNIGQIYGLEQTQAATGPGQPMKALVLELVEGPTLADRIAQGAMPIEDALGIATQIADALEAAHAQGVIHRDLKPANVKVREDGTVKVLDFGLAKAFSPDAGTSDLTLSPTISLTAAATQMGMIVGTAAYMAPEQAKGKPVDKRADVWAFGAVLFEMLAGEKPFPGEDVSDVLATVIKSEPDWEALPADTPPRVRQVLAACLAKQPKTRLHDMADVRLALGGTFDTPASATPEQVATPVARWQRPGPLAAAALLLAALGVGAGWLARTPEVPSPDVARFPIPVAPGAVNAIGNDRQIAISPDGFRLVYRDVATGSRPSLYVRQRDQLDAAPLRGAEGGIGPFFSPDGEWVGFTEVGAWVVKKVPITGGPSVTLGSVPDEAAPLGAAWGPDGRILFGQQTGGLVWMSDGGGATEPLTNLDAEGGERMHGWPAFIPDTTAALFVIMDGNSTGIGDLATVRLDTGAVTRLGLTGTSPRWLPSGHLVFALDDGSLRAVAFDRERLETIGNPVPVVEGVSVKAAGAGNYDLTENGDLFYLPGGANVGQRTVVWVDRDGVREPISAPPRNYTYARLSPDGRRVALDSRDDENDIWVWDLERETLLRLTRDPGMNRGPVWSPDGARIAFTATRDGVESIFWQAADGSGEPEMLHDTISFPAGFTPDGEQLLFGPQLAGAGDVGVLSVNGSEPPRMLLEEAFSEQNPQVSPDGRWLAYESNESGALEIYVRPFPDVESALYPVSTSGGSRPRWSADGSELFYYVGPDTIMAVPVASADELTLGRPEVAVQGSYAIPLNTGTHYDVSADGRRFLLIVDDTGDDRDAPPPQLVLVQHWMEEVRRLAPVP